MQLLNLGGYEKSLVALFHEFTKSTSQRDEFELLFKGVTPEFFYKLTSEMDRHPEKVHTNTTDTSIAGVRYSRYRPPHEYEFSTPVGPSFNTEGLLLENKGVSVDPPASFESPTQFIAVKKTLVHKLDLEEFDIRVKWSSEETLAPVTTLPQGPHYIRNKNRVSYRFKDCSLDMTVVTGESTPNSLPPSYEIELEVSRKMPFQGLIDMVYFILKVKQDSFFISPKSFISKKIDEYTKLVKTSKFIGAQPSTLHGKHLSELYKNDYAVTAKADGERCLIYIDKDGKVTAIDSNVSKVFATDLETVSFTNCILDAERIHTPTVTRYYIFDIIFHNGIDFRKTEDTERLFLGDRLDKISEILNTIKSTPTCTIELKEYFFYTVFLGSRVLYTNQKFKVDGLVFVPIHTAYKSSWPGLYKWKPKSQNTIDFYSENTPGTNDWYLYVKCNSDLKGADCKNQNSKTGGTMLFDVTAISGVKQQVDTFKTSFPRGAVDPTTGLPFVTGTVIEYKFDDKKFVPIKTRWDKTSNPRKHGNFVNVALDIWNNILNPVELENIVSQVKQMPGKNFENMRLAHNAFKALLYSRFITRGTHLELCIGRGGDLSKLKGVTHIAGYDVNSESVKECIKRNQSSRVNGTFECLDLSTPAAGREIQSRNSNKKFDSASCHFAVHYFLESQNTFNNFINVLNMNLKEGGKFVITYMDSRKLDQLFQDDKKAVYFKEAGAILYYIERVSHNTNSAFGNSIEVFLKGEKNILNAGSVEYIVDTEFLKKQFNTNGYKYIEGGPFTSDVSRLAQHEKDIYNLSHYMVIEKEVQTLKIEELVLDDKVLVKTLSTSNDKHSTVSDKHSTVSDKHSLPFVLNLEHNSSNALEELPFILKSGKSILGVDNMGLVAKYIDLALTSVSTSDLQSVKKFDLDSVKKMVKAYGVEVNVEEKLKDYPVDLSKVNLYFNKRSKTWFIVA